MVAVAFGMEGSLQEISTLCCSCSSSLASPCTYCGICSKYGATDHRDQLAPTDAAVSGQVAGVQEEVVEVVETIHSTLHHHTREILVRNLEVQELKKDGDRGSGLARWEERLRRTWLAIVTGTTEPAMDTGAVMEPVAVAVRDMALGRVPGQIREAALARGMRALGSGRRPVDSFLTAHSNSLYHVLMDNMQGHLLSLFSILRQLSLSLLGEAINSKAIHPNAASLLPNLPSVIAC